MSIVYYHEINRQKSSQIKQISSSLYDRQIFSFEILVITTYQFLIIFYHKIILNLKNLIIFWRELLVFWEKKLKEIKLICFLI